MRQGCISAILLAAALFAAPAAYATFPYHYGGAVPNDLEGKTEWMYAATPEQGNAVVNADPRELGGVRGASVVDRDQSVKTAWQTTTGRPDVTIAVLDSGIKWNDLAAMQDLRKKFRLNRGRAPATLDHPRKRVRPLCRLFDLLRRVGRQRSAPRCMARHDRKAHRRASAGGGGKGSPARR